jgi:hypothetical protein
VRKYEVSVTQAVFGRFRHLLPATGRGLDTRHALSPKLMLLPPTVRTRTKDARAEQEHRGGLRNRRRGRAHVDVVNLKCPTVHALEPQRRQVRETDEGENIAGEQPIGRDGLRDRATTDEGSRELHGERNEGTLFSSQSVIPLKSNALASEAATVKRLTVLMTVPVPVKSWLPVFGEISVELLTVKPLSVYDGPIIALSIPGWARESKVIVAARADAADDNSRNTEQSRRLAT